MPDNKGFADSQKSLLAGLFLQSLGNKGFSNFSQLWDNKKGVVSHSLIVSFLLSSKHCGKGVFITFHFEG